eukprot:GCRY01002578.1.p1 GENE.GCRY01002578.1~~GCRY01002578.1.p1  ORF type:complete len:171 (-),score=20.33 GCRY01002578.1:69-581(-)
MFFHLTLEKHITVQPRYFGPHLKQILLKNLYQEVEGVCDEVIGYTVCVTSVKNIGAGKVKEGSGFAVFPVKYQAVVYKPFRGEVVDAVVTQVNKFGFFAEAGPFRVFVSEKVIPMDIKFDHENSCYVSADQSIRIGKDNEVRLKVMGNRVDQNEIYAVGTIAEDYLGCIG